MAILRPGDPTSFIVAALAPAVALSACAILVSNAQSKYSLMIDRLRDLNTERRGYQWDSDLAPAKVLRLQSLERQIALLYRRARHLRDAIFLFFAALASIILTCLAIALERAGVRVLAALPEWTFLGGLLLAALGLVQELLEVRLSFRVVQFELELFDTTQAEQAERLFREV